MSRSIVGAWWLGVAVGFLAASSGQLLAQVESGGAPIVITGADRRPAVSLNGDWHAIPDPYQTGLYDFHKHELKRGWFGNEKAKQGDTGPIDYDFSKAETLKVPGDWEYAAPGVVLV